MIELLGAKSQLKRWVRDLPMADPNALVQKIEPVLCGLGQTRELNGDRIKICGMLNDALDAAVSNLDREYVNQSFPLSTKSAQAGQTAVALHHYTAEAYLLAASEMPTDRGPSFLTRRRMAKALHHAAYHLEQALLRCFMLYQPSRSGLWRDLHKTFRLALEADVAQEMVSAPNDKTQGKASVSHLYCQALLVSQACPYRLKQQSIRLLFDLAGLWSSNCTISSQPKQDKNAAALYVDPDLDEPPMFMDASQAKEHKTTWHLETQRLRMHLQKLLEANGHGGDLNLVMPDKSSVKVSRAMLGKLMTTWGLPPERLHKRLPARHQLRCVVGLRGAHYVAAGSRTLVDFAQHVLPNDLKRARRSENATFMGRFQTLEGEYVPDIAVSSVLDQSLGGYRLAWEADEGPRLRVGELVALSQPDLGIGEEPWFIGIVRWLHVEDNGRLEVGAELLSRAAKPVVVFEPGDGESKPMSRALVIPGVNDGPDQIIVPSAKLSEGDRMGFVSDSQRSHNIVEFELFALIEKTSEVSVFEFEPVTESTETTQEDSPSLSLVD